MPCGNEARKVNSPMRESKSILVVDKSRKVRERLLEILTSYGYEVQASETHTKALELLESGSVDLLIVEVGTLGASEETFIQDIRSNPLLEGLPAIVLATTKEVGEAATWVKMGCNDFLLKPVNPRILFQRVQSLIEEHPRTYNRVPCNVLAQGTTGSQDVVGELLDIGEGGGSLLLDHKLETEDIIKLTFLLPRQHGELTLGAEIIYVHERDGHYSHGLRFIILGHHTREKIKDFVRDKLLHDI